MVDLDLEAFEQMLQVSSPYTYAFSQQETQQKSRESADVKKYDRSRSRDREETPVQ